MWLIDPVNGKKSVTLSLVVLASLCIVVAGGLEVAGLTKTTSIFPELLYSSLATYLGRRLNIGSKSFSSEKAEEVAKKVD